MGLASLQSYGVLAFRTFMPSIPTLPQLRDELLWHDLGEIGKGRTEQAVEGFTVHSFKRITSAAASKDAGK